MARIQALNQIVAGERQNAEGQNGQVIHAGVYDLADPNRVQQVDVGANGAGSNNAEQGDGANRPRRRARRNNQEDANGGQQRRERRPRVGDQSSNNL